MQRVIERLNASAASPSSAVTLDERIHRRRRVPTSSGRWRASLLNLDIAIIAGTVTVGPPGTDGTNPNGLVGEGRVVTRRKQVGYKLLDIPLDTAHNFRAAAHNLANRCEPDELQYLQRIAMLVVDQTRDDTGITHATEAKRANRLRSRIDRLTQRRIALSAATRGGSASTWQLVNRRDGM